MFTSVHFKYPVSDYAIFLLTFLFHKKELVSIDRRPCFDPEEIRLQAQALPQVADSIFN